MHAARQTHSIQEGKCNRIKHSDGWNHIWFLIEQGTLSVSSTLTPTRFDEIEGDAPVGLVHAFTGFSYHAATEASNYMRNLFDSCDPKLLLPVFKMQREAQLLHSKCECKDSYTEANRVSARQEDAPLEIKTSMMTGRMCIKEVKPGNPKQAAEPSFGHGRRKSARVSKPVDRFPLDHSKQSVCSTVYQMDCTDPCLR